MHSIARPLCRLGSVAWLVAASGLAASSAPVAAAADDGVAMPASWVAASGTQVVQQFSPGVHRFFADAQAREQALPSYSLEREPAATAPTSDPAVKPLFGVIGGKQAVRITIMPGTSLYGTGEVAGQLLRNGRTVTTWNTDAYGYDDSAPSLYQSHPWVLALRPDGTCFGVLADTTYRCTIDTAAADPNEIRFIADGPAFPVIIIDKPTPQEVLTELANLTGKMPMPPKWAVGYHQCRYSYFPEARVREVASEFRKRSIPCDVIWFDIDYMEGFRIFTFDRGHFPDPKTLNADLHAQGFHNVWMINPGIKSRDERSPNDPPAEKRAGEPESLKQARAAEVANFVAIRDAGKSKDLYVKRADGSVYEGEVWPGWCFFPDYTNPTVRTWWAGLYPPFMAMGVDGVWNDMNEPAIFNVKSKTMPEENRHAGDASMVAPGGKPQGDRAAGDHARYHNVYGMQMIKATREGIAAANPDKRPFVLSRANFIGGQRYGATWTGDNTANWYHLEASIPMVLNVGLSGQPFIGPDIGGFAGNGDGALFARWMGFGALFPFSRGHTGKENIDKEPWSFGPQVEATSRAALEMRYRLLPYFYTLFEEASRNGLPVARPTFFADPRDPALRSEDDSFLLGDALLVQAHVMPDRSRAAVTPKGLWRTYWAPADPDLPTILQRGGTIVPTGPVIQHVQPGLMPEVILSVVLDAQGKASGSLYEDAGDGYGYAKGEFARTSYVASQVAGGAIEVKVAGREGSMAVAARPLKVQVLLEGPGGTTRIVSGEGTEAAGVTIRP